MFTLKKTFSILSIAALFLMACATDGDTGPAGPVGPEGALGPAGQDGVIGKDGTNGQDGQNGTASVIASTFFVGAASWTNPTTVSGIVNSINVPSITANIVRNGVVLLYQTDDNSVPTSTIWTAVPYTDGIFSYVFSYGPGVVNLKITVTLNGSAPTLGAASDHSYKVVVITPGAKIAGMVYGNYDEVKMIYGLED